MNKFNARKIVVGGETFDSQKEYSRWCELKLLEKAREIQGLQRQVKYVLIPAQKDSNGKCIERECAYIADFVYVDNKATKLVVEDVKGYKKGAAYETFVIKRKLFLERFGIRIKET